MMKRIVLATTMIAAGVAVFGSALAEPNGRPPPIKLGQPTPASSQTPIKIGKPAPTPTPTPTTAKVDGEVLSHLDMNKMMDVALKLPLKPSIYQWQAGQPAVQLQPAKTHLCVLTGVSGNFRGAGERVEMKVDMAAAGGPRYVLAGSSGQGQLRANAICVSKDRFTPGMLDAKNVTHSNQAVLLNSYCNTARKAFSSDGPEYTYLVREFGGRFDGLGDFVRAAGNSFYVSACAGYAVGSGSGVHMIGSGPVKFIGPTGVTTSWQVARFYATKDNPAPGKESVTPVTMATPDRWLVPVDKAICGLAEVGGRFNGYGEAAEIVIAPNNGVLYWKAQVSNGLAGSGVNMAVRCIARDQR